MVGNILFEERHAGAPRVRIAGAVLVAALGIVCRAEDVSYDSYVQDGLIAQWDGVFNATNGEGVAYHDPNSTTWVDLTGRHPDMVFVNGTSISGSCYDMANDKGGYITSCVDVVEAVLNRAITVEMLCDFPSQDDGTLFACLDKDSNRILWVRSAPHTDPNAQGCVQSAEYAAGVGAGDWTGIANFDDGELNYMRLYSFVGSAASLDVYKDASVSSWVAPYAGVTAYDSASAWFSIGRRRSAGGMSDAIGKMKIYSLRVYNRCLTADERKRNKIVDDLRFRPRPAPFPDPSDLVRSYRQDGLIAQWDGVLNATNGEGVAYHDPNSTTWVDLTGRHPDMVFVNGTSISGSCYDMANDKGGYITSCVDVVQAVVNGAITVEMLCDFPSQDGTLFACLDKDSNRILWVRSAPHTDPNARGCVASAEYAAGVGAGAWTGIANFDDGELNYMRLYSFVGDTGSLNVYKDASVSSWVASCARVTAYDPASAWFSIGRRRSVGGMSDAIGEMKIYSLRVYNRCLTANDRAWNKSVDDKRFMGLQTTNLVVTAENGESVGPVDPAYGAYTDIRTGTYYECSAAAAGNFGGAAYKCLGYSLYTNDATGAWREWRSDATNRVMVCQPSNTVKLVWHWKRKNGMTVILR